MKKVYLRFYAELNDFLPTRQRQKVFIHHFTLNPSVKDIIESCGVPHSEIDVILVNNDSVDFNHRLLNNDRVSVYPVFESLDISPLIRLRAKPLRVTKFILDDTLGKLVRKLRMLGFDSIYEKGEDKNKFIEKSLKDKRIILTKSRNLLKCKSISHGYWVRAINIDEQIKEIVSRFDLLTQIEPFQRCMVCNGQIKSVPKNKVENLIPEKTGLYYNKFWQCEHCNNIYWKGTHFERMQDQIRNIIPSYKI